MQRGGWVQGSLRRMRSKGLIKYVGTRRTTNPRKNTNTNTNTNTQTHTHMARCTSLTHCRCHGLSKALTPQPRQASSPKKPPPRSRPRTVATLVEDEAAPNPKHEYTSDVRMSYVRECAPAAPHGHAPPRLNEPCVRTVRWPVPFRVCY